MTKKYEVEIKNEETCWSKGGGWTKRYLNKKKVELSEEDYKDCEERHNVAVAKLKKILGKE
jgi:hypothetical protein